MDEGVTVVLDGSGSDDANGDTLTYAWVAPAGITLSDATVVNPVFTAPEVDSDTDFTLSLVVNDGQVDSVESTVVVTVSDVAPVAPTSEAPSGGGTESDPYLIASLNNLYWLSQTPSEWGSGKYFKQTADIDAASTSNLDNGSGFTPLGTSSNGDESLGFHGTYNGDGHVISNLYINRPTADYVGFVALGSAKLNDLGLEDVNIKGKGRLGSLIGLSKSGARINRCYSTGQIEGSGGGGIGGLVGWVQNSLIVNDCYTRCKIVGSGNTVGGFVGDGFSGSASITNSYSSGEISVSGTSFARLRWFGGCGAAKCILEY